MHPLLHVEFVGTGPRVVLAHGFTQTGKVWGPLAADLAGDHEVGLVDLPGHGQSAAIAADLEQSGRLLGDAGGRAIYLGYSMGARVALHLALASPGTVLALVLVSGTAGLDAATDRAARRRADEALAARLDPPAPRRHRTSGRGQAGTGPIRVDDPQERVDRFLRRWLDQPLFEGTPVDADGFEERRRNTPGGLASSLRLAGTGTQQPLWDRIDGLAMPVLVVTGERDARFAALGQRLADTIGSNAEHVVVPDAGHPVHLHQPERVARLVRDFEGRHGDPVRSTSPNRSTTRG